jgi:hypothetical protein
VKILLAFTLMILGSQSKAEQNQLSEERLLACDHRGGYHVGSNQVYRENTTGTLTIANSSESKVIAYVNGNYIEPLAEIEIGEQVTSSFPAGCNIVEVYTSPGISFGTKLREV